MLGLRAFSEVNNPKTASWRGGLFWRPCQRYFWFLAKDFIATHLRNAEVIAVTTVVFGLLLWWADKTSRRDLTVYQTGWRKALLIGFAQALALIPGLRALVPL